MRWLVDQGVQCDTNLGEKALILAIKRYNVEATKFLLYQGALVSNEYKLDRILKDHPTDRTQDLNEIINLLIYYHNPEFEYLLKRRIQA